MKKIHFILSSLTPLTALNKYISKIFLTDLNMTKAKLKLLSKIISLIATN